MYVKFGGPNLLEGYHTWYEELDSDGHVVARREARPGDVVEASKIGNSSRPGKAIAAEFVSRGMAMFYNPASETEVPSEEE